MDNLGMWCKFMKFSGDSVIESGSDGEQHIAVADCHICCIGTMHAKVSDIEWMVCGDRAFSHYGCDNRYFCLFHYFPENFMGAGDYCTAACQE